MLYETKARFWLVGSNKKKTEFAVLKIDRTHETELSLQDDPTRYSRAEIQSLLQMIAEGNAAHGGLQRRASAYGVLGFIRFLHGYYLLLITKRKKVGSIGVHSLYKVAQVTDLYIPNPDFASSKQSRGWQESKYKTLFFSMALNHFYFSYSYDLTRTLQFNMTAEQKHRMVYNEGFVWNEYLLQDLIKASARDSPWVLPMIHGYLKENKFSLHGRQFNIVLIARRSRHFAGTRFLKRGVNERGQVANAVECEQIVYDESSSITQLAHDFTSFVQIRGSIPLFWGQDGSVLAPKPPIAIQRVDPFYTATILHFEDLFRNFGAPIIVLNLVKHEEKKPRESLLGDQFQAAVDEINHNIPEELRLQFINCDFSRFSKTKGCDVVAIMNEIAEASLKKTGYFHAGRWLYANYLRRDIFPEPGIAHYRDTDTPGRFQTGLLRSNCIDSLDRTNAAQFITGKVAFGYQLYALGVTDSPGADFDSPHVQILLDMYQGMGNTLALQYGGSRLAHTIGTYREKTLAHHSRDLLASLKRFYSNSFTDKEKQDSINLFLGNFCPWKDKVNLWDLETDYHLHMKKAESFPETFLFTNRKWWEPALKIFYSRILSHPLVSLRMLLRDRSSTTAPNISPSPLPSPRSLTSQSSANNISASNTPAPPPPPISRQALLRCVLDDLYDPEQLTSFDMVFSRPSNIPSQLAVADTDPSVSFQNFYRLMPPEKAQQQQDQKKKQQQQQEDSNQGKKGQMLLSLYGIKKWFTFVQDSQKSGSTSRIFPLVPKFIGSGTRNQKAERPRRSSRASSAEHHLGMYVDSPAEQVLFNPYQLFADLADDFSLRLDCLPVDVRIYRSYLAKRASPSIDLPYLPHFNTSAPSRSASTPGPAAANKPQAQDDKRLSSSPPLITVSSPLIQEAPPSPSAVPLAGHHPSQPSAPSFRFTISSVSKETYVHYASLAQPSYFKSIEVDATRYLSSVALTQNLTINDLKCSSRSIQAIKSSFRIIPKIAESSFYDGWFIPFQDFQK